MRKAGAALSLTPEELRVEGFKVLSRELGPAAALRFVLAYEPGRGDYSQQRHRLIDHLTDAQVADLIERSARGRRTPARRGSRGRRN